MAEDREPDLVAPGMALVFGIAGFGITVSRLQWWAALVGVVIAVLVWATVVVVGSVTFRRRRRRSAEARGLLEDATRAPVETPEAKKLLAALRAHYLLVREGDDGKHEDLVDRLLADMRRETGRLESESESDAADLRDAAETLKSAARNARKKLDEDRK